MNWRDQTHVEICEKMDELNDPGNKKYLDFYEWDNDQWFEHILENIYRIERSVTVDELFDKIDKIRSEIDDSDTPNVILGKMNAIRNIQKIIESDIL